MPLPSKATGTQVPAISRKQGCTASWTMMSPKMGRQPPCHPSEAVSAKEPTPDPQHILTPPPAQALPMTCSVASPGSEAVSQGPLRPGKQSHQQIPWSHKHSQLRARQLRDANGLLQGKEGSTRLSLPSAPLPSHTPRLEGPAAAPWAQELAFRHCSHCHLTEEEQESG